MIGAPPTFFDPDLEAQPQTQNYHDWTTAYTDPQLALTSTSPYPHQHSTTDARPESQAQSTPQHRDQYQFVTQPPPSTPSDAAHYPYLSQFIDPSNSLSQAMPSQGWSQQSSVFSQVPASNNSYLMTQAIGQYSTTYDPAQTQHQQPEHITPHLAVTPGSDTTLHSASRISPASANNALPSPGTASSNTPTRTVIVHPSSKRGGKSTSAKQVRKRQKSETDDDDDEDLSIDTSLPRPNPNRL